MTGGPNEIWSFGDEAYAILRTTSCCASGCGLTCTSRPGRPAGRAYPSCARSWSSPPEDEGSWTIDDQFMFGRDLLVAPVPEQGARRAVDLPAGADWTDAWTGAPS